MPFGAGHCVGIPSPLEVSLTNLSLSCIFMVFTLVGNILVIMAVVVNPYKDLRSPFTLLIANLAVADFLVGALMEPLSIYIHYRESKGLSIQMAWLSQTTYFLCCTASLLSLAVLTVDRYLAITRPVWYRAEVSLKRVLLTSLATWVLSMAITSLYFLVGFVSYAFMFANVAILSTFLVFIFTYVRVFQILKEQMENLSAMEGVNAAAERRHIDREARITQTYMTVLIVFLACYVPSCIMIYLMNMCSTCSCELIHWFRDLQYILVVVNSLINPLVYAIRMPNFRRAILAMFKVSMCCHSNIVRPPEDLNASTIATQSVFITTS
ncbi:histamine H2 receptor [Nematostella vectensis]|uniref:histamine H2 receptor n=1 Tax=Nematostella vectensis TaxID=45351 RepID=UPI002077129E|nr:histamine H2 receptor [Nematostella vectensis]